VSAFPGMANISQGKSPFIKRNNAKVVVNVGAAEGGENEAQSYCRKKNVALTQRKNFGEGKDSRSGYIGITLKQREAQEKKRLGN